MKVAPPRLMYLPDSDRSFWQSRAEDEPEHQLLYLGWGERQFGETPCPITRHHGWMYAVVEQGCPTLVTESGRHRIDAGTAIIVGPDHASGWNDEGSRVCRLLTWIWKEPATTLVPAQRRDEFRKIRLPRLIFERIQTLHALCRDEVQQADSVMSVALGGLHRVLEAMLARPDLVRSESHRQIERVNLAVRWMESHLECRKPAVRIADYLGISASTLHRLFKQQIGSSPDAHFHGLKMSAAKRRLHDGMAVKEVAYGLGYRHPGDFTRAYTRYFGHTPGMDGM